MKEFIIVRDALTDNLMIIRKSMIGIVEEDSKDKKSVRKITYTDRRDEDYVTDSLIDIIRELEPNNG